MRLINLKVKMAQKLDSSQDILDIKLKEYRERKPVPPKPSFLSRDNDISTGSTLNILLYIKIKLEYWADNNRLDKYPVLYRWARTGINNPAIPKAAEISEFINRFSNLVTEINVKHPESVSFTILDCHHYVEEDGSDTYYSKWFAAKQESESSKGITLHDSYIDDLSDVLIHRFTLTKAKISCQKMDYQIDSEIEDFLSEIIIYLTQLNTEAIEIFAQLKLNYKEKLPKKQTRPKSINTSVKKYNTNPENVESTLLDFSQLNLNVTVPVKKTSTIVKSDITYASILKKDPEKIRPIDHDGLHWVPVEIIFNGIKTTALIQKNILNQK